MIFISEEQRQVLQLVNDRIDKNKTYFEIMQELSDLGYRLRVECKGSYIPKSYVEIVSKDNLSTFVWLHKKRNGLAYWETIKLS